MNVDECNLFNISHFSVFKKSSLKHVSMRTDGCSLRINHLTLNSQSFFYKSIFPSVTGISTFLLCIADLKINLPYFCCSLPVTCTGAEGICHPLYLIRQPNDFIAIAFLRVSFVNLCTEGLCGCGGGGGGAVVVLWLTQVDAKTCE